MKRTILFSCFILAVMMSFHCRKRIDADSWMVGEWRTLVADEGLQTILIRSDGMGRYNSVTTDRKDFDRVRLRDKDFKIGMKQFDILDAATPYDTTGYSQSWMHGLYPSDPPPTMKMKVRLPFFWGNEGRVFYKWEF